MSEPEVLAILERVGAIITNSHLVYTSGRHGSVYVNKDALYTHPAYTSAVCKRIAEYFAHANAELVAGPTVGGVILAQWTAYHSPPLANGQSTLAIYAEEEGSGESSKRVFRRGYADLVPGKRVLIVEDVLTTGGSARKVVEAVEALGGEVVGIGVLCNRGGVTADALGVPELYALTTLPAESWAAEECPLCHQGVPINTRVGKGGKQ